MSPSISTFMKCPIFPYTCGLSPETPSYHSTVKIPRKSILLVQKKERTTADSAGSIGEYYAVCIFNLYHQRTVDPQKFVLPTHFSITRKNRHLFKFQFTLKDPLTSSLPPRRSFKAFKGSS
ncbi:hypothetical protein LOAG_06467 [Loa loa]|uniref:Uncharacterized protein n=1 Tax=Loa loa TaxID=7209 RepID=A0A1S0TZG3_LOALO|nr:hypothetical protein LOAG_06467 [Loa loa]EFO22020.1 hypothetical protein LOAG_06467 [Loa loa]